MDKSIGEQNEKQIVDRQLDASRSMFTYKHTTRTKNPEKNVMV